MLGLSVRGNVPPNATQPKLPDGIHLRWAFDRSAGFPWYGYYLFRRDHNAGDLTATTVDLTGLATGTSGSAVLNTPQGQLSSDVALTLTEDFPPTNVHEFDLANRGYLRFIPSDLANEVDLAIGFRATGAIMITGYFEQVPVATTEVKGTAGQVVQAVLKSDAISSLELSSGAAALVNLAFLAVSNGATAHWQALANFQYPLALPVAHPDYPCPSKPANGPAAETLALGRIRYGPPGPWSGSNFIALHDELSKLVVGGPPPAGQPMASRGGPVATSPPSAGTMYQAPLDLVLLGALNPPIAQMVGLYWVDETASAGQRYDYLILADSTGNLGGNATAALQFLRTNGFGGVDGFIVFDQTLDTPAPPLAAPKDPRVYALPAASATSTVVAPGTNRAGLNWDRGVTPLGVLLPDRSVLHHVWRAALGNGTTPTAGGTFALVTQSGPVLVADAVSGAPNQPRSPTDWPPFRLYFVDSGLADGWYGYQISGIDIFGRHSANSGSAPWYQWTPAPSPLPWYYTAPPGDTIVHPSSVALRDETPPPPPTGVEAYALDPDDKTVLQDSAYTAWRQGLSPAEQSLIGLRARWLWTQERMEQAPDTREFRIYFQPAPTNALLGNTTAVAAVDAKKSTVATDIPNTRAANAYVGATLQIGGDGFQIVASDATSPLNLTVKNIGPNKDVPPAAAMPCTLAIPGRVPGGTPPHALFVDYSIPTNWSDRYYVVGYADHVTETLVVLAAPSGGALMGTAATAAGNVVALDGTPDVSGADVVGSYVQLDADTARADHLYRIFDVDLTAGSITVDAAPTLSGASPWRMGRRLRRYEVFLPSPGDSYRAGVPLTPSYTEPVVYAEIGVSAADDKQYAVDDPKWAAGRWGGAVRYGNEGWIGQTATIFRVLRGKPLAPVTPPLDSDRVYATAADYNSRSFYTYRWTPTSGLKTHIFRALDDAVFNTDWNGPARASLDPVNSAGDRKLFPTEPSWDPTKLQAVATELNQLNAKKGTGISTADAMTEYALLSNDALRVLAGLPGNESAFTQLTIQPLDPTDPANADRRGPNDSAGYTPLASLRAFVDALDGRTTSRYFYRALYVDGAHNRSTLSAATPPVYCPDVVPPRAPTVTRALGGDRIATLQWTVNRDADLDRYLVFRSESRELLSNFDGLAPAEVLPQAGVEAQLFVDQPLIGNRTYYYCVAARDTAGNVSGASRIFAVYVTDTLPASQPPGLAAARAQRTLSGGVTQQGVQVSWSAPPDSLEYQVQRRRPGEAIWQTLNVGWLPAGTLDYFDSSAPPDTRFQYRLRVRKASRNLNSTFTVVEVSK